ncbi:MAG: hypothetical protein M1469_10400 [Bacteroidetes bacterium]|nr:hypothetical protein [Bacteroidota bacterium]
MRGDGFTVIPEEKLDECVRLLEEYPDQALLGMELYRKRSESDNSSVRAILVNV